MTVPSNLSARNRRILALGVRGAAKEEPDLEVDALLTRAENLTDLTDDDLAALEADLIAAAQLLLENPTDETLETAERISASVEKLRTEAATRIDHATENREKAAEIVAKLTPVPEPEVEVEADDEPPAADTGPDDDEPEDDEPEGEPETPEADAPETPEAEVEPEVAEPIAAAAAKPKPAPARASARRPDFARPRPTKKAPELVLRASANVPSVPAGMVLDTNEKIADTFDKALRASGIGQSRYTGGRMEIPVMSLGAWDPADVFGDARTLGRDSHSNARKIDDVTSLRALRATGGICAPLQVDYSLPFLGSTARPVRDAFARFGADRGGARFLTPPTLADVTDAVSVWTEANDVNPGSDGAATKACATLDCPDEFEQMVAAIVSCLQVGNFRQKFFPEQVRAWMDLVAIRAAQVAENRLIQKLGDESVNVDVDNELLGATRTLLPALDRARAGFTSSHRLDDNYPLRMLAPQWLKHMLIADLAREAPGSTDERLATGEAKIQSFFSARNINVSWFLDGEAGQVFTQQGAGFLNGWPDTVVIYLYLEGTWLHLDGGSLDFGIVRDSILNGTNDMQIMSEFFEESVFHGPPDTSYRIELDICPTGEAAGLVDTSSLCTSGS